MAQVLYLALASWAIYLTVGIENHAILSGSQNLGILVNSDNLLPAQMAWDVHHNWHAWTHFQWPRVPSLVPDMVYFWGAEVFGLSWRQAFLGYDWVIVTAFIGAIGLAAFFMQAKPGRSFGASLLLASLIQCLTVTACYFGQAAFGIMSWKDLLSSLAPATHGDGMLFSLLATAAAAQASEGGRTAKRLALVFCFLGTFCDLLFVFEFLVPFIAVERWPYVKFACIAFVKAVRDSSPQPGKSRWLQRAILRRFVIAALDHGTLIRDLLIASVLGWAATHLLFRQDVAIVDVKALFTTIPLIYKDLFRSPWTAVTILATALLVPYVAVTFARERTGLAGATIGPRPMTRRQLILGTAAGASVISLLMLIPLYVETYNWRYAIAAEIWPATVLIAVIAPRARPAVCIALGALTLVLVQTAFATELRRSPDLLQWHSDVDRCAISAGQHHHLEAGLATYWNSRQTEASSDWKQQVTMIDDLGRPRTWGNDTWYFSHDMARTNSPARFNFIIIDKAMKLPEIVKRYGVPASIHGCPDKAVWIYDHNLVLAKTP